MNESNQWKLRNELLWAVALIVLGIFSRFAIDTPNFKPVAAIGLIAGLSMSRRWLVFGSPLLVLAISDLGLASYDWAIRLAVYGGLCSGCVAGLWLRSRTRRRGDELPHVGPVVAFSLIGSSCFFLISNSAWWLATGSHPFSVAGWSACLLAGLPFFKSTLLADLFFTSALYFVWVALVDLSQLRWGTRGRIALAKVPARSHLPEKVLSPTNN